MAHVIVVGSGLAGLSAALEAHHAGASVTIVEKEARLGGNSAKATSGINGAGTEAQAAQGIHDTAEALLEDTLRSGHGLNDKCLAGVLASQSAEAVAWLHGQHKIALGRIAQCGGHSRPRTHRITAGPDGKAPPVGWKIVATLRERVESLRETGVHVLTTTRVVGLLREEVTLPACAGVSRKQGNAVVLASGGYAFAASDDPDSLLRRYAPQACAYPTTNGHFAVGDGVKLAQEAGVSLVDMDQVQVHPTAFVDPQNEGAHTKFLAPEALRAAGGILLSHEGERFTNELVERDVLVAAMHREAEREHREGGPSAYLVLSQGAADAFGADAVQFYAAKGLVRAVHGVDELAAAIPSASVETLRRTLAAFHEAVEAGSDAFGRSVLPAEFDPEGVLYVAKVTPAVHYTMGGMHINAVGEALAASADGTPQPVHGLFGAGEVTGGVHGGNRLAGNSLLECVVFGRRAGRRAARHALVGDGCGLHSDRWARLSLQHAEHRADQALQLTFDLPRPWQRVGGTPGQLVDLRAPGGSDHVSLPIAHVAGRGRVDLLLSVSSAEEGPVVKYAAELRPGGEMELRLGQAPEAQTWHAVSATGEAALLLLALLAISSWLLLRRGR